MTLSYHLVNSVEYYHNKAFFSDSYNNAVHLPPPPMFRQKIMTNSTPLAQTPPKLPEELQDRIFEHATGLLSTLNPLCKEDLKTVHHLALTSAPLTSAPNSSNNRLDPASKKSLIPHSFTTARDAFINKVNCCKNLILTIRNEIKHFLETSHPSFTTLSRDKQKIFGRGFH